MGTVAAIDVETGEISCELDVGVRPSEALVTRRGRIGYVSVRNENTIKEIDVSSCRLTGRSLDLGEQVDTLSLTRDEAHLSVGLRGPAPSPPGSPWSTSRRFVRATSGSGRSRVER